MARSFAAGLTGCCLLVLGSSFSQAIAKDEVIIEPQSDALVVKIEGSGFTTFHYGSSLPKPYFWPVNAADGALLTRPILPNEKEHPHHRGIWLAVDEVNDVKFWAEQGRIETRQIRHASGNPARISLVNEWVKRNESVIMTEQTTISIHPNRLIAYDVTLAAPTGQLVRFDDTKEGFFGIRIAESMREKEGGSVVNSEGKMTTRECWGRPARWVDYTGPVNGKLYGVALMDHPENFRPSRYHVRDYGLFSVSPFGEGAYQNDKEKAKFVIMDNERPSLRIRYALFVHDGPFVAATVEEAYDQFLRTTSDDRSK